MRHHLAKIVSAAVLLVGIGAAFYMYGPATKAPLKAAATEWPMIEGDWGNTRYSTLDALNVANVHELGGAWVFKLEGETSRATPIVVNGRMYLTAGQHVYALNPKTGDVLWKYKPPAPAVGLYKGVSFGEGKIFVGLSDSKVVALDAVSGAFLWAQAIGDVTTSANADKPQTAVGQFISTAPAYVNGLVIAPMVNGDYNVRGRVVALDAKTGKIVWRFYTIPAPGEYGSETWEDNGEWRNGGGGVWTTPAVDPDLGLVYIGVGNPVPQWGGELRGGDNLFSDSLVALDIKTGQRRWHFQLVHHDIWEQDLGTPPIFYDAVADGKPRKGIGAIRTDGSLFLLDRATGKPIFPVEERPVPQNTRVKTAAKQPYLVGADRIAPPCPFPESIPKGFKPVCQFDPVDFDMPNAMYPILSSRASRMAYSPKNKLFYVAATPARPFWIRRYEDPRFFSAVGLNVPGIKTFGLMAAIDSQTNKIAWQKRVPYEIHSGSGFAATAGDLLFHGEPDGNFQALDARSGDLLWQFQTGANAQGAAMTYEIDGEQYVAAAATTAIWAFKRGGTLAPQPAPPPPPAETSLTGRIVATNEISMSAVIKDSGLGIEREAFDEYLFKPLRARTKVGEKVVWKNTGKETHSATAVDGSWTTGPLAPGKEATVVFKKPGTYLYNCAEHPWTYGEIIVEE